ncbi:hypothetical protein KL918_001818 [Ogataea parapolymorpha]|uniref:Uncharacterized protein n=1 Tax=Ogataea parapolymorpha (strain ATCC 26012 / BCRC 20466 / JCM 22074 / NRRL Y-7560 / DL-1) TaxID=871575 RepID=W1QCL1_OGAPD|nr:hypothetical protein HPODL_04401 [Ogataea parapolymorpha DL-1]ESW98791.1 hypothetical protein HPODL_04401 [Ogataea parapolymorpha DL-1]KAG7868160.1 hypothetical protein KL918_001818 [Ogataea parapolymorpha]KAG7874220.1 hypothetical protein KL916_001560 [Ogataea parapolymorpha]
MAFEIADYSLVADDDITTITTTVVATYTLFSSSIAGIGLQKQTQAKRSQISLTLGLVLPLAIVAAAITGLYLWNLLRKRRKQNTQIHSYTAPILAISRTSTVSSTDSSISKLSMYSSEHTVVDSPQVVRFGPLETQWISTPIAAFKGMVRKSTYAIVDRAGAAAEYSPVFLKSFNLKARDAAATEPQTPPGSAPLKNTQLLKFARHPAAQG